MSNYHIIIQQERRTQPERMAFVLGSSIPTGDGDYVAGPSQLHIMATRDEIYAGRIKTAVANGWEEIALILQEQAAMGVTPDFSDPLFVMVAEWDLQAPYVIVHKGDYAARNLHFGGWPEITKEQFDALDAATPAA